MQIVCNEHYIEASLMRNLTLYDWSICCLAIMSLAFHVDVRI